MNKQQNNSAIYKVKVGVLGGGVSGEREVSLESSRCTVDALNQRGINTVYIDINTSTDSEVKKLIKNYNIDVAFIALHGEFGEDGQIQKILQDLGILYTGSTPLASYKAMDKIVAKKVFIEEGIPTPSFCVLENSNVAPGDIEFPVVVKPYFSGSSLGVSIAREKRDLQSAIAKARGLQNKVILEKYINGREVTVGILDEKALGVVEIIPKKGYYDFETKYTDGMAEFVAPADLNKDIYENIQTVGLAAHNALGCRHFSRVDVRLAEDNIVYVLEVNSIPGLTSHSLLPLSAKCCGISFSDLVLNMVELALNGQKI